MEQRAAMAEQIISGQVIEACQQGDRDAFRILFELIKTRSTRLLSTQLVIDRLLMM